MGVGADISNAKIYDVPVTMDMRIYTDRKKATPFFAFGFGFDEHIEQNNYGIRNDNPAIVFNPSFGSRIAINKKQAISVGLGYKLLAIHYQYIPKLDRFAKFTNKS